MSGMRCGRLSGCFFFFFLEVHESGFDHGNLQALKAAALMTASRDWLPKGSCLSVSCQLASLRREQDWLFDLCQEWTPFLWGRLGMSGTAPHRQVQARGRSSWQGRKAKPGAVRRLLQPTSTPRLQQCFAKRCSCLLTPSPNLDDTGSRSFQRFPHPAPHCQDLPALDCCGGFRQRENGRVLGEDTRAPGRRPKMIVCRWILRLWPYAYTAASDVVCCHL
ncbi:hypothetical protein VTK26DRAFT_7554 [Humicola hyalothermophila]